MKRILSLILVFVILFSFVVFPVSAKEYTSELGFWDWILSSIVLGGSDFVDHYLGTESEDIANRFNAQLMDAYCSRSWDNLHHCSSEDLKSRTTSSGGLEWIGFCRYCGQGFAVNGADIAPNYDDLVDDLPATGIDSDGGLYFRLPLTKFLYLAPGLDSPYDQLSIDSYTVSDDIVYFVFSTTQSFNATRLYICYEADLPVSGHYSLVWPDYSSVSISRISGSTYRNPSIYFNFSGTSGSSFLAGDSFYRTCEILSIYNNGRYSANVPLYFLYKVTPSVSLPDVTWNLFNIDTRVGSLTGNLGIIAGDNNTLTQIQNNYIFNETNNTFYSPTYNTYSPVTNWYYDYTTRTYQLTLDGGLTVKIAYGDEYITVNEGDTVYNVYYIINDDGGGSGEDPDPTPTPGPGGEDPDGPDDPGPGGDEDRAGIIGWLEKIYNKLCDILDAIFGLDLNPDIDVDVDVTIDGEKGNQKSWFKKLVSKFNWTTQLKKIFKQLVDDVTSDAGSAAAISDGIITVDMLSSGHAVPIDGGIQVYTAPELNITMGSSNAYGVDWGNIKVIDLSWYAEYKDTVDRIISGFLWLGYIYLLIKRAPEIIKGSGMVSEHLGDSD